MPLSHLARLARRWAAGDQVLLRRQVLEHPPALEHLGDAELASHRTARMPSMRLSSKLDGALGDLAALGAQHTGNRLQRRRLAGTVGAKQRRDRAPPTSSDTPFSTRMTLS